MATHPALVRPVARAAQTVAALQAHPRLARPTVAAKAAQVAKLAALLPVRPTASLAPPTPTLHPTLALPTARPARPTTLLAPAPLVPPTVATAPHHTAATALVPQAPHLHLRLALRLPLAPLALPRHRAPTQARRPALPHQPSTLVRPLPTGPPSQSLLLRWVLPRSSRRC